MRALATTLLTVLLSTPAWGFGLGSVGVYGDLLMWDLAPSGGGQTVPDAAFEVESFWESGSTADISATGDVESYSPCLYRFRDTTDYTDLDAHEEIIKRNHLFTFDDPDSGSWSRGARSNASTPHPKNIEDSPWAGHVYEPASFPSTCGGVACATFAPDLWTKSGVTQQVKTAEFRLDSDGDGVPNGNQPGLLECKDPEDAGSPWAAAAANKCFHDGTAPGGCPKGGTEINANPASVDLAAVMESNGCDDQTIRCWLEEGATFDMDTVLNLTANAARRRIHGLGYGATGTPATVNCLGAAGGNCIYIEEGASNVEIMDLNMDGNGTTGRAIGTEPPGPGVSNILILRVDVQDFDDGFYFRCNSDGAWLEPDPTAVVTQMMWIVDSPAHNGAGLGGYEHYYCASKSGVLGGGGFDKQMWPTNQEHNGRFKLWHQSILAHGDWGLHGSVASFDGCGGGDEGGNPRKHAITIRSGLADSLGDDRGTADVSDDIPLHTGASREFSVIDNHVRFCSGGGNAFNVEATSDTYCMEYMQDYLVLGNLLEDGETEVSSPLYTKFSGHYFRVSNNYGYAASDGTGSTSNPRMFRVGNRQGEDTSQTPGQPDGCGRSGPPSSFPNSQWTSNAYVENNTCVFRDTVPGDGYCVTMIGPNGVGINVTNDSFARNNVLYDQAGGGDATLLDNPAGAEVTTGGNLEVTTNPFQAIQGSSEPTRDMNSILPIEDGVLVNTGVTVPWPVDAYYVEVFGTHDIGARQTTTGEPPPPPPPTGGDDRYLVLDDAACVAAGEDFEDADCWADTSGGAGGAGVPSSSNDCLLDANSGSGTLALGVDGACATMTWVDPAGITIDLAGNTLTCADDCFLNGGSNMNIISTVVPGRIAVDSALQIAGDWVGGNSANEMCSTAGSGYPIELEYTGLASQLIFSPGSELLGEEIPCWRNLIFPAGASSWTITHIGVWPTGHDINIWHDIECNEGVGNGTLTINQNRTQGSGFTTTMEMQHRTGASADVTQCQTIDFRIGRYENDSGGVATYDLDGGDIFTAAPGSPFIFDTTGGATHVLTLINDTLDIPQARWVVDKCPKVDLAGFGANVGRIDAGNAGATGCRAEIEIGASTLAVAAGTSTNGEISLGDGDAGTIKPEAFLHLANAASVVTSTGRLVVEETNAAVFNELQGTAGALAQFGGAQPATCSAGTAYVRNSGNDANACTDGAPCLTLAGALRAGSTIGATLDTNECVKLERNQTHNVQAVAGNYTLPCTGTAGSTRGWVGLNDTGGAGADPILSMGGTFNLQFDDCDLYLYDVDIQW